MDRAYSRSHPTCDAIKYQALRYFTQHQSMLLSRDDEWRHIVHRKIANHIRMENVRKLFSIDRVHRVCAVCTQPFNSSTQFHRIDSLRISDFRNKYRVWRTHWPAHAYPFVRSMDVFQKQWQRATVTFALTATRYSHNKQQRQQYWEEMHSQQRIQ